MPTRTQIEARTLEVYDLIKSGARCEDSLVELKAVWPPPDKAARRLAGHANAARGEGILWIIGLDEDRGVCPLNSADLANWWPQVGRWFDGPAPPLSDVVVHTEDGPIQALYFDVSLSPFVIKNPAYGSTGGGPVEREVPWREGTRIRSATREDLIRLPVPIQQLPEVEVLHARVIRIEPLESREARSKVADGIAPSARFLWHLHMKLYVTPQQDQLVVFPVHRTSILSRLGDKGDPSYEAFDIIYSTPTTGFLANLQRDSASVETTQSEAIIHLPGRVHVNAKFSDAGEIPTAQYLAIRFSVRPVHTHHVLQLRVNLPPVQPDGDDQLKWEIWADAGAPGSW